jgi:hypothetical protein
MSMSTENRGPALENRAGLLPGPLAALARIVAAQPTLMEVVRWGLAQHPPRITVGVIPQDEYTHDVIVPYEDGTYLVYDTT